MLKLLVDMRKLLIGFFLTVTLFTIGLLSPLSTQAAKKCGQEEYCEPITLSNPNPKCYSTGCLLINIGGIGAPGSWECPALQVCYLFNPKAGIHGTCGVDPYNGKITFCSVATGNRVIVPDYKGCSRTGETCVTNLSDEGEVTCPVTGPGGGTGIKTAIGCIPIGDATQLVNFVLSWALGIAGGIAFLLILFAGFQIITSRGDPNRLKAGQELLTSAIAGLVLIIFSVFILRVIGFNILNISVFAPQ